MRKRAKMRLAVLGGMIAGAVAGCWLLDMLEAAANWMLVHWMGLDLGRAARRAPAMSGLLLCGLFGVGLYLYCRWDENRQYVRQARRAPSGTERSTAAMPAWKSRTTDRKKRRVGDTDMIRMKSRRSVKAMLASVWKQKKLTEWKFYSWPFGALQGWCGSL